MSSTVSTSQGFHPSARNGSFESSSVLASCSSGQLELEFNGGNEVGLISVSWNQGYGRFAGGTIHEFPIIYKTFQGNFQARSQKRGIQKSLRCCSGATIWHL
ncbi:hypothetical protein OIU79_024200 [Salix purpurea]|uniref:Uncharacterized protein n=1 Tax=Salix purpurea TaxID=77065 RepID=A0A9Q0WAG0_SALPP|nr:hypothetical protein OIU79_024200 [Salix purpurea]